MKICFSTKKFQKAFPWKKTHFLFFLPPPIINGRPLSRLCFTFLFLTKVLSWGRGGGQQDQRANWPPPPQRTKLGHLCLDSRGIWSKFWAICQSWGGGGEAWPFWLPTGSAPEISSNNSNENAGALTRPPALCPLCQHSLSTMKRRR